MTRRNGKKLALDADLTLVHDSQPASLVSVRTTGRWVWRCHFDCSPAQAGTWSLFRQFADQYDAAVFALPGFEGRLGIPMYVIPPSIDPLSERNRDLPAREVTEIRSEEHTSELQSRPHLVCRLLLEKKKNNCSS